MKRRSLSFLSILIVLISLIPFRSAHADVAPPLTPPGANLNPGDELTQVRMVAETVILSVRQDPADTQGALADTTASFTMRNLGTQAETMQARFPLSFVGGDSDGFGNFPEISQISVTVNGNPVSTQRVLQPAVSANGSAYIERAEVPWAVFDVTFPVGQDVTIAVAYTVQGFGYYPYEAFQYILETGAGWKDTIGSADIIVRFPYEVSGYNVWLSDDTTGYSQTTPGAAVSGKEVSWHFENLEPTRESNIEITVVAPSLWQKVLSERDTVGKNPNDGEAWGRLGKAYKEIAIMQKHGDPRTDKDGRELLGLSRQAYEKCLALLPNDSLWHFGYADLLWSQFYFDVYMAYQPDTENLLPLILRELKTSLELDPGNQRAKDLLTYISSMIPGSLSISDSGIDYLGLTATPIPPTPYLFVTETPVASPTIAITPSYTPAVTLPSPVASVIPTTVPTPRPGGPPICAGTALLVPLLMSLFWWKRKIS